MSLLLGFESGPKHCQEVTTRYIRELNKSLWSSVLFVSLTEPLVWVPTHQLRHVSPN